MISWAPFILLTIVWIGYIHGWPLSLPPVRSSFLNNKILRMSVWQGEAKVSPPQKDDEVHLSAKPWIKKTDPSSSPSYSVLNDGTATTRSSRRPQPYKKSKYSPTKRLLRTASSSRTWSSGAKQNADKSQQLKYSIPQLPSMKEILGSRGLNSLTDFVRRCPTAAEFDSSERSDSSSSSTASPEELLSHAIISYNARINATTTFTAAEDDVIFSLFTNIVQSGISKIKLGPCNKLLKELGSKGYLSTCERIISQMRFAGIAPDIITYSTMISRAGMWSQSQLAESYFIQMQRDGLQPNQRILIAMMQAFAKSGDPERTLDFFQKALDSSIAVDHSYSGTTIWKDNASSFLVSGCNSVLKHLGDKGFLEKCDIFLSMMFTGGIQADLITFNTLIARAANWKKIAKAEAYFVKLLMSGLRPDLLIFNSLMNAYSKCGDFDAALNLLRDMEAGRLPQFALLALAAADYKVAATVAVSDNNSSSNSSSSCSSSDISGSSSSRNTGLRKIVARVDTFNTLIAACMQTGAVVNANTAMEMLSARDLKPDYQTYSTLIHIYCQAEQVDAAFQMLKRMKAEGIEPTAVTYSTLLHGLGKAGRIDDAVRMVQLMKKSDMRLNVVTISSLIDACGRFGHLDQAFSIFENMLQEPDPANRPNSITCSALVDACLKEKLVDRAFSVVQYMREHHLALTEVTYTSLIAELTKLRQLHRIVDMVLSEPEHGIAAAPQTFLQQSLSMFPYSAKTIRMTNTWEENSDIQMQQHQSPPPQQQQQQQQQQSDLRKQQQGQTSVRTTSTIAETIVAKVASSSALNANTVLDVQSSLPSLSNETANDLLLLLDAVRAVCNTMRILDERILKEQRSELSSDVFELVSSGADAAKLVLKESDIFERMQHEFSIYNRKHDFQPYKEAMQILSEGSTVAKRLERSFKIFQQYEQVSAGTHSAEQAAVKFAEFFESNKQRAAEEKFIRKMTAFKEQQKHSEVISVYNEMQESGVEHGTQAYRVLMDSIYESPAPLSSDGSDSGNSNGSTSFATEQSQQQQQFKAADAALRTAVSKKEEKERILLLSLKQIETRHDRFDKQLHRQNQLFRLYLVFQEMKARGIEPDTAVYNSLINACAGAGEVSKAMETLESMRLEGIEPDVITYTNLIKACVIAASNSTRFIENNPQQRELTPIQIAEDFFESMQQKNNHFSSYIAPNRGTYSQLIRVHWLAINENTANALLMKYQPTTYSFVDQQNGLPVSDSQQHDAVTQISASNQRIWHLYEELIQRGLSPTFMTYKTCLKASALVGGRLGMERCLQIVDNIRHDPMMQADARCWKIALNAVKREINVLDSGKYTNRSGGGGSSSTSSSSSREEYERLSVVAKNLMVEIDEIIGEKSLVEESDPWDDYLVS